MSRNISKPLHKISLRTVVRATMLGAIVALVACSDGEGADTIGDGTDKPVTPTPQTCKPGQVKDCTVTLGEHNGVLSCYQGSQTCDDKGAWSECSGGKITGRHTDTSADRSFSGAGLKTAAGGVDCNNNPCDPTCQTFTEDPDVGLTSETGGPAYDWDVGSLSDFPSGLVNKGIKQPCFSGSDCQFNEYCQNVSSGGTCSHHKCSTGAALSASCDTCVSMICAQKPECCLSTCGHDPCEIGTKLTSTCNSCVAQICAADPTCCSDAWDSACVAKVATVCNQQCNCKPGELSYGGHCYYLNTSSLSWYSARTACQARGAGWDLASITSSAENAFLTPHVPNWTWMGLNDQASEGTYKWANGEPFSFANWASAPSSSNDCAEIRTSGSWYTESCSYAESSFCEGPGLASTPAGWSQQCVDAVSSICDAKCSTANPPVSNGTCTPWLPGETDPKCTGIDLSVGVPCTGSIPICNHGQTEAPAGIKVVTFPANSQQYPQCAPNLKDNQMTECTTTEKIPPGECIELKGCIQQNENLREIMVNPTNITGHIDECSCLDNWSLTKDNASACGNPDCSGAVEQANIKPVNMFFLVDRSGSMYGTKWNATTSAMKAFFKSTAAAGLNVAFEYFPLPKSGNVDGCGSSNCTASYCGNALVDFGVLTAAASPTDTQEQELVAALTNYGASGNTPTYAAMGGALGKLATMATGNVVNVVVLVTDGEPNDCCPGGDCNAAIGNLAQSAFLTNGIRTYTIGMAGANITALNSIASKGGTGSAFVINGSDTAAVAAQLSAALSAIAGQSVSCDIGLPNNNLFDIQDSQVIYIAGGGSSSTIPQVTDASMCGSGWYFDNNYNPTKIVLCPNTCSNIKVDTSARVEIHLGCPKLYEPTSYQQAYTHTCPPGTVAQWGFLAYDATTPLDSYVEISARTADTKAGLASQPWTQLTIAKTATGNSVCPLNAGTALCPVDLFKKIGLPGDVRPWIELKETAYPSYNGRWPSTLNSWELTFSCPAAE